MAPTVDQPDRTLVAMLQALFPHHRLDEGAYRRAAHALLDSASSDKQRRCALCAGLAELDRRDPERFAELPRDQQQARLAEVVGSSLWQVVYPAAVVALYGDPEVGRALGYESAPTRD